jgi:hypothetical protein
VLPRVGHVAKNRARARRVEVPEVDLVELADLPAGRLDRGFDLDRATTRPGPSSNVSMSAQRAPASVDPLAYGCRLERGVAAA